MKLIFVFFLLLICSSFTKGRKIKGDVQKVIEVAGAIDKIYSACTGGLSAPVEIGSLAIGAINHTIRCQLAIYMMKNEEKLAAITNVVRNNTYPDKKDIAHVKGCIEMARNAMRTIACDDNAKDFYPVAVIKLCGNVAYGLANDKKLCRDPVRCGEKK